MTKAITCCTVLLVVVWQLISGHIAIATGESNSSSTPQTDVLSKVEWDRLDNSVERALAWLAKQQQSDGSFSTLPQGQPAITGLCTMAFLAHGHLPNEGPYGRQLSQAVRYMASCQKDSGLIALMGPEGGIYRGGASHRVGGALSYNHAISSLALSEIYGVSAEKNTHMLRPVIESSLSLTLQMQRWKKRRKPDEGGWRYLHEHQYDREPFDSDLSVTGWYIMSLRSAKNAGFEVPKQPIDNAVWYVKRCFHKEFGTFQMVASDYDRRSRGMAGAGVLALAHAGMHESREAQLAGQWILEHDFSQYNRALPFTHTYVDDRYHYSVFNCCQAMYQLGGRFWEEFFPPTAKVLLDNQQPSGSWPPESNHDGDYGETYTTSLVLLTLGAPNQLLPVFQR